MKPQFFVNEQLSRVAFEWRLLFAGLWTQADRAGRLEDRPRRLKAALFPYDDIDVDAGLSCLEAVGLITRYVARQGQRLIAIPSWSKHQQPHHQEPASSYPPPPDAPVTVVAHEDMLPLAFDEADADDRSLPNDFGSDPGRIALVPGTGTGYRVPGTGTGAARAVDVAAASPANTTRQERFEQFWQAYPRKHGRGAAFRSWERLRPTDALLVRMLAAIDQQRKSDQWLRGFIPKPSNWLDDEGWLDQPVEVVAGGNGAHRTRAPGMSAQQLDQFTRQNEMKRLMREEGLSRKDAMARVGWH